MVKIVCCCVPQMHITDEMLYEYIKIHGNHLRPLSHLRDLLPPSDETLEMTTIRQAFQMSNIPFRVKPCAYGIQICCGMCTRTCDSRCVQDILHRSYLYLSQQEGNIEDWPAVLKALHTAITFPLSHKQIDMGLVSIIGLHYNSELLERMRSYGVANKNRYVQHPHKFNYAPRYVEDVDPESGFIKLLDWPGSGLCPFALPPYKRKPGRKFKDRTTKTNVRDPDSNK